MTIWNLLFEARKKKKISLEKMADDIGINRKTIRRIELGKSDPRFSTLKIIAKYLDIELTANYKNIAHIQQK